MSPWREPSSEARGAACFPPSIPFRYLRRGGDVPRRRVARAAGRRGRRARVRRRARLAARGAAPRHAGRARDDRDRREPAAAAGGDAAPVRWPLAGGVWWLYTPGVAAIASAWAGCVARCWRRCRRRGGRAGGVRGSSFATCPARRGMPVVVAHGWVARCRSRRPSPPRSRSWAPTSARRSTARRARAARRLRRLRFHGHARAGTLLHPRADVRAVGGPRRAPAWASCALATLGALAGAAALGVAPRLLGIAAAGAGCRRRVPSSADGRRFPDGDAPRARRSFRLVRIAWGVLAASLVLALPWRSTSPTASPRCSVALIAGWLLPFCWASCSASSRSSRRCTRPREASAADALVAHRRAAARHPLRLPRRGACAARARGLAGSGSPRAAAALRDGRGAGLRGVLRDRHAADGAHRGRAAGRAGGLTRIN